MPLDKGAAMAEKTVGVLTGGGDCPGLNAAIRAITKTAQNDFGWRVLGIADGYDGLVKGRARELTPDDVSNILPAGGTILGTSNKANPFEYFCKNGKASDMSEKAVANLKKWGIDALFCIGGDGTLAIASRLQKIWPHVVGVPKTIDNDLAATDQTFGFDTACGFVTEAIDRIHSTALSHHRVMVVEVMGRYAGWIALEGGLAGGGDVILIPEIPFKWDSVAGAVERRVKRGKRSSIVVVAEGAKPQGEDYTVKRIVADSPDKIRLGGIGMRVADEIEKRTGREARVTVLGHLQRGGSPTFFDRVLATRYGFAAVELAKKEIFGKMVALRVPDVVPVDLQKATGTLRLVKPDQALVKTARSMGTSFGD